MFSISRTTGLFFRMAVLLVSGGLLEACSSGTDVAVPAPETGSIQGVVGPPGAAILATATDNKNHVFTAVPDRGTGAYSFGNVAPGFCTVYFTAAAGFGAYSSAMPLVQPNQTAQAGATFMSIVAGASISGVAVWQYDAGKTAGSQQLGGSLSADSLRIVALSSVSLGTDVVLRVKPFTGVGTYALNTSNNTAVFRRYLPTGAVTYLSNSAATSGILTVTGYDATRRTLVGTFAFTANALPPATGTVTVTAGGLDLQFR